MPILTTNPVATDQADATSPATAAATNTMFTAVTTATTNLSAQNFRTEAVDTRNLSEGTIIFQSDKYNGYTRTLGAAAQAYASFAASGVKEREISHGSGVRVSLGPAGLAVNTGDIIRLDWTVTLWDIIKEDDPDELPGPETGLPCVGSGYGEWCYLIYPKVDITSNALANFVSIQPLTAAQVVDISNVAPGRGNGFRTDQTEHFSVVPMHYIQMYSILVAGNYVSTYYAQGNQLSASYLRPRVIRGSYWMRVSNNRTIYGFSLFTGGVWRLDVVAGNLVMFLEDEVCDPGTAKYGVSDGVELERATLGVSIFRGVS